MNISSIKERLSIKVGISVAIVIIAFIVGFVLVNKSKADVRGGYGYGCATGYGSYGYGLRLPDSCSSWKTQYRDSGSSNNYNLVAYLYDFYGKPAYNMPYIVRFNIEEVNTNGSVPIISGYETRVAYNDYKASVKIPLVSGKKYKFEAFTQDTQGHFVQIMGNDAGSKEYSRYYEFIAVPNPVITHDVQLIRLVAKPNPVRVSNTTNLSFTIRNNGTTTESKAIFSLSFNGKTFAGTPIQIGPIAPGKSRITTISVQIISTIQPGDYIVTGSIQPISGETNISNNTASITLRVIK